MPKAFYLIDGFNLAVGGGLIKSLDGPGNVERARSRLLSWLQARLNETERACTTVVFDAAPGSVDAAEMLIEGIRVRFAVDYPDADSLLEEIINQHSAPKQLVVISSDRRVKDAARRRRCRVISSADWRDQMENRPTAEPRRQPSDEKPVAGTDRELAAEFDSADIQQLLRDEVQPEPRGRSRFKPRRSRG
jgi:hypothetical protein